MISGGRLTGAQALQRTVLVLAGDVPWAKAGTRSYRFPDPRARAAMDAMFAQVGSWLAAEEDLFLSILYVILRHDQNAGAPVSEWSQASKLSLSRLDEAVQLRLRVVVAATEGGDEFRRLLGMLLLDRRTSLISR